MSDEYEAPYREESPGKPEETISNAMASWRSALQQVFHGLSFILTLCALLLPFFPSPLLIFLIDLCFGEGTARDAQGGAFGMIYLIFGLAFFAFISFVIASSIGFDAKRKRYSSLALVNGIGCITAAIVFFCAIFIMNRFFR